MPYQSRLEATKLASSRPTIDREDSIYIAAPQTTVDPGLLMYGVQAHNEDDTCHESSQYLAPIPPTCVVNIVRCGGHRKVNSVAMF
jgi:hypothetical protein